MKSKSLSTNYTKTVLTDMSGKLLLRNDQEGRGSFPANLVVWDTQDRRSEQSRTVRCKQTVLELQLVNTL